MGVIFNVDTGSASSRDVGGIFGSEGTLLKAGANVDGVEKLGTADGVAKLGTKARNVTERLNRRTIARESRANFENMPFATEGGTASSRSAAHHGLTSRGSDGSGLSGSTGISEPRIAATASARLDSTSLPKASRCSISPQTEHWKVLQFESGNQKSLLSDFLLQAHLCATRQTPHRPSPLTQAATLGVL